MPDIDRDALPEPFEVEIVDLDPVETTGGSRPSRPARFLLRWQRPEWRHQRRRLTNLVLVGLALTLLFALFNSFAGLTTLLTSLWSSHQARIHSSPIALQRSVQPAADIVCPVQSAWSPDSSLVGVLGYTQSCNQDGYAVAQVDLYDAATARQIEHWRPDDLVFAALQAAVPPVMRASLDHKPDPSQDPSVPAIHYQQLIWSPGNTRLALNFTITTRFQPYAGLFLMNRDGSQGRVLLYSENPQLDARQVQPLLWDLQSGQGTPLTISAQTLAYSWGEHGELLPADVPDEKNGTGSLSVGNPDGGSSFTVWQPGRAITLSLMHEPSAYLWYTSFAAWSPDGRYLVTNFSFAGLMEPPGRMFPTPGALREMEVNDALEIAPHDPALIPSSASALIEAWNPAGTILAVYDLRGMIGLYACQSGQLLRSLKPASAHPLTGSTTLLSWSPDGRSLLLSSSQWGLISLWKGSSLALA